MEDSELMLKLELRMLDREGDSVTVVTRDSSCNRATVAARSRCSRRMVRDLVCQDVEN